MSQSDSRQSRRQFVRSSLAIGAALPVMLGSSMRSAQAQMPQLEESDPAAVALKYKHDATAVDAATRGGDDRVCSNCRFYADPAAEWAACQLFPGKAVKGTGWCAGWAAIA